jgi:hypothetical protein
MAYGGVSPPGQGASKGKVQPKELYNVLREAAKRPPHSDCGGLSGGELDTACAGS